MQDILKRRRMNLLDDDTRTGNYHSRNDVVDSRRVIRSRIHLLFLYRSMLPSKMTPEQIAQLARLLGHAFHNERDRRRDAAFNEPELSRQYRDLQASEVMHSAGMVFLRFSEQVIEL